MEATSSLDVSISQVFPSYLFKHLDEELRYKTFIEMVALEFWWRDTQQVLKLVNNNFSLSNVLIQEPTEWQWTKETEWILYGKYRRKREQDRVDLSHAKRVKSSGKEGTVLIVLTSSFFLKHILNQSSQEDSTSYDKEFIALKTLYDLWPDKQEVNEDNIIEAILKIGILVQVPDEPIVVKNIHKLIFQEWPTTYKIGEIPEYSHNKGTTEIVKSMFELLTSNFNQIEEVCEKNSSHKKSDQNSQDVWMHSYALLYNPSTMKVCCESIPYEISTSIDHPIMRLFEIHGKHLCQIEKDEEIKVCDEDNLGQYFAKDLWLFTLSEPCYM